MAQTIREAGADGSAIRKVKHDARSPARKAERHRRESNPLTPINRFRTISTKKAVADRVRDVEVAAGHQSLVVMNDVVLSQLADEWQPTNPRFGIDMVGEVQYLVIQKIKDRG